MHHLHLHLLPLLVATFMLWFLGAAWYSPAVFAKPWMAMLKLERDPTRRGSIFFAMFASLVGDFLVALALGHFVAWSGADSLGWGALVGFIAWLGFFAAPNFPQGIYERRPFGVFLVNNGYWLVGLLAVGAMLGVWR
ncbi:MAG TPA: DUF1761 domain-containing protein [Terracidiphilus sp.]|nr:DUF1761 domain-containing protein [Terracidiphilus sp.]